MRSRLLILLILLLSYSIPSVSQITTPVIRANFGVDADLRTNFFNGFVQSGNDDWFNNGTLGIGQFVIDTTGAAYITSQYVSNPSTRLNVFFRGQRFPQFSIINNRLLIDALFTRDYHGDDSTTFSGGNKNGMNPKDWSCPVAQGVPDKNEILDMMVHVRRAGPTFTDSLWMFGGLSLENTTGNRYFDFEMYQTDIFYNRPTQKFYGYGPDDGHTSWQLDASGNVTVPGDIIFTAEYSSSSLSNLEARIWVNKNTMSITPQNFVWTGAFDGAGSGAQYGYAGILPKTAGAFYTGLQCNNNTWVGPFNLIRADNSIATVYNARQYMEFSVNLTKLGLDPVDLLGSTDKCQTPFRRILVKSRASVSFNAELKDFVGPIDLFIAPVAEAAASLPVLCDDAAVSDITVTNAIPTSVYTWTTTDGHIVTSPNGPTITVDQAGTYVVEQRLTADCAVYATDTVVVLRDFGCVILKNGIVNFHGALNGNQVDLSWMADKNEEMSWFEIERSENGMNFSPVGKVDAKAGSNSLVSYAFSDDVSEYTGTQAYYRLKIRSRNGSTTYSSVIRVSLSGHQAVGVSITPNPVRNQMQINIQSPSSQTVNYRLMDGSGRTVYYGHTMVTKGLNSISYADFDSWAPGVYMLQVFMGEKTFQQKFILSK